MAGKVFLGVILGVCALVFVSLALGWGGTGAQDYVRRHRGLVFTVATAATLAEILFVLSLAFGRS